MRPKGAPTVVQKMWRSHTTKVLSSVATPKASAHETGVARRTNKKRPPVKQRPFKLTSGQPDPWNPRIEAFVQDPNCPEKR